jgi:drug/metabolite transporter (DMT)-like permease
VLLAAWGYVGGARLARTMPGWQVICWGVAAPLPLTVAWAAVIAWTVPDLGARLLGASAATWIGLLWVGLVSQVLGFLPWYAALAWGGIARIGRLQLMQPGLSVLVAWLLLAEQPRPSALLALAVVVGCLVVGRRQPSAQPAGIPVAVPRAASQAA